MKELDLLLERFVQEHYDHQPPARQRAFERLLALPDPVLAELLLAPLPDTAKVALARDLSLAEVIALVAASGPR